MSDVVESGDGGRGGRRVGYRRYGGGRRGYGEYFYWIVCVGCCGGSEGGEIWFVIGVFVVWVG